MDRIFIPSGSRSIILFYSLIAVGNLLNSLMRNMSGSVTDSAGVVWRLQDIYAVTGLIAIFTMGTFIVLGLVKLMEVSPVVQNVIAESPSYSIAPNGLTRQME